MVNMLDYHPPTPDPSIPREKKGTGKQQHCDTCRGLLHPRDGHGTMYSCMYMVMAGALQYAEQVQ
jgi:hypothetical protein